MTDKLSIYNGALAVVGERSLASLTEDREPRRLLDEVWDRDGVKRCLQQGQWNFACRSVRIEYESSITPEFGYTYAFEKPTDFVRTMGVYSDHSLTVSLTDYTDESGYWWADFTPLYVRYVSDDSQYGGDYSLWPPNFTAFVEHWFASQIVKRLTASGANKEDIDRDLAKVLREAKNSDAMEQGSRRPPVSSWNRARGGRSDRRRRTQLIG